MLDLNLLTANIHMGFSAWRRRFVLPELRQAIRSVSAGAIVAAMAHIPAGLGALEATFIALLGDRLPQSQLLAALLVYRAVYYLVPLLLAILVYSGFEARMLASRQRSRGPSGRRE